MVNGTTFPLHKYFLQKTLTHGDANGPNIQGWTQTCRNKGRIYGACSYHLSHDLKGSGNRGYDLCFSVCLTLRCIFVARYPRFNLDTKMKTLSERILDAHTSKSQGETFCPPHVYTRHEWIKWLSSHDYVIEYAADEDKILQELLHTENRYVKFVLLDDLDWFLCVGKP